MHQDKVSKFIILVDDEIIRETNIDTDAFRAIILWKGLLYGLIYLNLSDSHHRCAFRAIAIAIDAIEK